MIKIKNFLFGKKGGLNYRTQAVINYATANSLTPPSNIVAFNELISNISGILDKMDAFYLFSNDSANGFRLINIANTSQFNAGQYNALDFQNNGVKGDGVSGYIHTNYLISTTFGGKKYLQNNACRLAIISEANSADLNVSTIDGNALVHTNSSSNSILNFNITAQRINQNGSNQDVSVDFSGTGLKSISRISATQCLSVSQSTQTSSISSSTELPASGQTIFRRRISAAYAYGAMRLACYGIGGALSFAETQELRLHFNNYLIAIGESPIA